MQLPSDIACFVGRAEALDYLRGLVQAPNAQSVSLIAYPGFGRSTLLRHIARNSGDGPIAYALVGLDRITGGPDDFFAALARSLRVAAPALGALLDKPPCESWLEEVVQVLVNGGSRLVLVLDDFQYLTRNARFPAQFYEFFRSLASTETGFALIISSDLPLSALSQTVALDGSPFPNIFSTYRLGPLDKPDIATFIKSCLPAGAHMPDEDIGVLGDLAGGCPFLLRLALTHLAHLSATSIVSVSATPDEIRVFLADTEPHFHRLWPLLSEREQHICLDSAQPNTSIAAVEAQNLVDRGLLVWEGKRPVPACFALRSFLARQLGQEASFTRRRGNWWGRMFSKRK